MFRPSTAWTSDVSTGPAQGDRKLESAVGIAEVNQRFLQCLWLFHEEKHILSKHVCQVYSLPLKTIEYKRRGYAVATHEQVERIKKVSKRELMRRGINQHTLRENLRAAAGAGDQACKVSEGA